MHNLNILRFNYTVFYILSNIILLLGVYGHLNVRHLYKASSIYMQIKMKSVKPLGILYGKKEKLKLNMGV